MGLLVDHVERAKEDEDLVERCPTARSCRASPLKSPTANDEPKLKSWPLERLLVGQGSVGVPFHCTSWTVPCPPMAISSKPPSSRSPTATGRNA